MTKEDMGKKLFCTFTQKAEIDNQLEIIGKNYRFNTNKIFIFYIKSNNEYAITYNVESEGEILPPNTISVHRKKESNTLQTLNALNELIKKLNGGVVDVTFPINWSHYRNCILLTNNNEVKQLNTRVHEIITF